jgi:hypothetical protein
MAKHFFILKKGEFPKTKSKMAILIRYDGNEDYLKKVVEEAKVAEKIGPLQFQYTIYEINHVHYCMVDDCACKYSQVVRRVRFRLDNNRWISKRKVRIHIEGDKLFYMDV